MLQTPFGPDGRPRYVPQWQVSGMSCAGASLGAWRESVLKPAGPWVVGLVLVTCLLHVVVVGPRRSVASPTQATVFRYRVSERVGHALGMATFVILSVTGLAFLFGASSPLGQPARDLHAVAGFVFAAAVVGLVGLWARDARLAAHDREWFRHLGGYLGFRGHLPAGKLNAGQKLYFWFAAFAGIGLLATGTLTTWPGPFRAWLPFAYTLHDLLAILMLVGVSAHFYLAVVANPGALRGVIEGSVDAECAREHHSHWEEAAPGGTGDR